jgi:site-specific recombinase XerD
MSNPFRKVSRPTQARARLGYLSGEECRCLREAASSSPCPLPARRDRATLTLMIFTGARRSDALDLTWGNVDLD